MRGVVFKVTMWILSILSVIAVVPLVWNYFCKKSELDKVRSAYGQEIEIAGIKMTADVKGQGNKPTIILLPGWGSSSPILAPHGANDPSYNLLMTFIELELVS